MPRTGTVPGRTAEHEASTTELDAFTYSVSHDLRAPLRALNGFSQALLKDYGGDIDPVGWTTCAGSEAPPTGWGS